MKIKLLCVGRLRESYLRDAEAEYQKRLRPYCQLEVVEVKDEAALLAACGQRAHVYMLDERGEELTSRDFARDIIAAEEQHGGGAEVVFAIGGPEGHSQAARRRATRLLAFGKLTIAHRLVRLLIHEQIYRAYKIVRGEPYHRD